MRVTNRVMYDSFLNNMQSTLGAYMESNIQGGSQKKINKPSDDPAGMALVLNTRRNIDNTTQYQRNVDTANGWVGQADKTLMQVSSTIEQIKTLIGQATTETVTAENRTQIAFQIRQLFGQLLNHSNAQFENKSIFAGHKYDESAFDEKLMAFSKDSNFPADQCVVEGKSDKAMAVRFKQDGVVGTDALDYEWSKDGGKTWTKDTLPAGSNRITVDGVSLTMPQGAPVKGAVEDTVNSKDGTMIYLTPTASYEGDDGDPNAYGLVRNGPPGLNTRINGTVTEPIRFELLNAPDLNDSTSTVQYSINGGPAQTMQVPTPATGKIEIPFSVGGSSGTLELDATGAGSSTLPVGTSVDMQPRRTDIMGGQPGMQANTQGTFKNNTLVRLNKDVDLAAFASEVDYSYSTDGGATWINAKSSVPAAPANTRLTVPGGYVELTSTGSQFTPAGTQMVIHPDRANLDYEIMQNTYVSVNNVGKDIFGGQYNGRSVEEPNLFNTVGKLISYLEYNDSDGIGECLADITKAHEKVETANTRIGGVLNRLTMAADMHTFSKLDQQQRLSYTEDIDLTTLLNNLAKQELAYNTVLKTSSMIMQLNLTKFV